MTAKMARNPANNGLFNGREPAPLPADYAEGGDTEDHYDMDGFDDQEFSDASDYENNNMGVEAGSESDEEDYLEPSEHGTGKGAQRTCSFSNRAVPPPPGSGVPPRQALPTPTPIGQRAPAAAPNLPPPRAGTTPASRPSLPPPPEDEQEEYQAVDEVAPSLPPPRPAATFPPGRSSQPPQPPPLRHSGSSGMSRQSQSSQEDNRGTVYESADEYDGEEEEEEVEYDQTTEDQAPSIPSTPRPKQNRGSLPAIPPSTRAPAPIPQQEEIYAEAEDDGPTDTYEAVEIIPSRGALPPLPKDRQPPPPPETQEVYEDPNDAPQSQRSPPPLPAAREPVREEVYEACADEGDIYEETGETEAEAPPQPPPLPQQSESRPPLPRERNGTPAKPKTQPPAGAALMPKLGDGTIKERLNKLKPTGRQLFEKSSPAEETPQTDFRALLKKTPGSPPQASTEPPPPSPMSTGAKPPAPATKAKKPWTRPAPPPADTIPQVPRAAWQVGGGPGVKGENSRSGGSSPSHSGSGVIGSPPPVALKIAAAADDFPPPPPPEDIAPPCTPPISSMPDMPPPPPPTDRPAARPGTPPITSIPEMPPPPPPSRGGVPLTAAPPATPKHTLETQPWYQNVERLDAEQQLRALQQSGSFLVRKSNKGGASNPYTLTLFFNYKMYNLHIRHRPDGQWALGKEKPGEQTFGSVAELITYHRQYELILTPANNVTAGGKTVLGTWPAK